MYFLDFSVVERYIKDKEKLKIKNPKTLITYLFPYYAGESDGNISKYARGKDYHIVVKEALESEILRLKSSYNKGEFVAFCDNSPLPEVKIAHLSGAGVLGKNGLIFDKEYGGYVFIGIILTDLEMDFEKATPKNCISCNKCINACPTNALTDKDFSKCLSELTQTNRELLENEENFLKNSRYLWGCDICLDVCPMNKDIKYTEILEFLENTVHFVEIPQKLTRNEFKEIYKDRAFTFRGPKPFYRNVKLKNLNKKS